MRHLRTLTAVAIALAASAVCQPALAAEGAESIEALMKQIEGAGNSGNMGDVIGLVHPDDRPMYGLALMLAGSFTPMAYMNDEKKATAVSQEWDALLKKHKVDISTPDDMPASQDPAEIKMRARALFKDVDLNAFVKDASTFIQKHSKKEEGEGGPSITPSGTLEDIKIDGDSATAMLGGKPQRFNKVDGRWYIRMDM